MKNKNKEKLIFYRDIFWRKMIIESVGKEVFEKIRSHIEDRLYSSEPYEFEIFNISE